MLFLLLLSHLAGLTVGAMLGMRSWATPGPILLATGGLATIIVSTIVIAYKKRGSISHKILTRVWMWWLGMAMNAAGCAWGILGEWPRVAVLQRMDPDRVGVILAVTTIGVFLVACAWTNAPVSLSGMDLWGSDSVEKANPRKESS